MVYRNDIQVLRGIAVLMVVLFHLEMAGFNSGFLGVDVFFVISGYLMAQMYSASDKAGFFVKRAKRLLPAYFATVIATLLASMLVVAPNDYKQVSDQALFATVFASNLGFWLQNSYFNKEEFKPLLHLWSLGVEIQFYLFIPLLHWVFTRIRFSFGVVLLATAGCCFLLLSVSTKTAFFWMPWRMWEFLLGYGVAKYLTRPSTGSRLEPWLGGGALIGVVALPLIKLDGSAMGFVHGHPVLMARAISICTAAALHFRWPQKALANPLARGLKRAGDYSYSIYLAHFPVIVLFLYKPFSGTVLKASDWTQSVVMALSVAAASALLFMLIEKPFRAQRFALRWMGAAAFASLALAPLGALIQRQLVAPQDMLVYDAWFDRDPFRCGTSYRMLHPMSVSCAVGDGLESPAQRVLLVGNSHADSIKSAFSKVARTKNVAEYFIADNGPLMPGGLNPQGVIDEVRKVKASALVVHFAPRTIEVGVLSRMAKLARENGIPMSLIMPVPVWRTHVPKMILLSRQGLMPMASSNLVDYEQNNSALIAALPDLKAQNVKIYQTASAFCRPECELMSETGKPLYYDSGHLTLTGSAKLEGVFEQVVEDLK